MARECRDTTRLSHVGPENDRRRLGQTRLALGRNGSTPRRRPAQAGRQWIKGRCGGDQPSGQLIAGDHGAGRSGSRRSETSARSDRRRTRVKGPDIKVQMVGHSRHHIGDRHDFRRSSSQPRPDCGGLLPLNAHTVKLAVEIFKRKSRQTPERSCTTGGL